MIYSIVIENVLNYSYLISYKMKLYKYKSLFVKFLNRMRIRIVNVLLKSDT